MSELRKEKIGPVEEVVRGGGIGKSENRPGQRGSSRWRIQEKRESVTSKKRKADGKSISKYSFIELSKAS